MDPDYLRIERPTLDLVALAKALGGQDGEIVEQPRNVREAVRRGGLGGAHVEDVRLLILKHIVYAAPPPAEVTAAPMLAH